MKISKQFTTETAHIVRTALSEKCKNNIHGHTYQWQITLMPNDFGYCDINNKNTQIGMLIDYKALDPIKNFIDLFDHSMVLWEKEDEIFINFIKNHTKRWIIMKRNPTAENMARLLFNYTARWIHHQRINDIKIFDQIAVHSVTVKETANSTAIAETYWPDDIISECSSELYKELGFYRDVIANNEIESNE